MAKILTIVIPTYNMDKYLHRCLDSLLIKEPNLFHLLEILVINDGSKDRSSEIAHEYESKYPDVFHVIDKENGNYGSCINRGIDDARGKFLKILDADDWYDTDALTSLLKTLSSFDDNIDAVFTEFTYHNFYDNTHREYRYKTIKYGIIYDLKDIPFVGSVDEFMLKMYSIAIKLEILRSLSLRLNTGISYTDSQYIYFPYDSIKQVVFLNENVYQYFIGREGQTISPITMKKNINDLFIIAMRYINDYVTNKHLYSTDCVKQVKEYFIIEYCLFYFNNVLGMKAHADYENDFRKLYNMVKNEKDIILQIRKRSPYFILWERLGIYKSDKWFKPFYCLFQGLKKLSIK